MKRILGLGMNYRKRRGVFDEREFFDVPRVVALLHERYCALRLCYSTVF